MNFINQAPTIVTRPSLGRGKRQGVFWLFEHYGIGVYLEFETWKSGFGALTLVIFFILVVILLKIVVF
jgi:hypothetical protein